jgi:hypothetical protein
MRHEKKHSRLLGVLCVTLGLLVWLVPAAQARRTVISEQAVATNATPTGQIEDACGLALDSGGRFFVSDYYHRAVTVFSSGGGYQDQVPTGVSPQGPCGLAVSASGALYVNYYHQGVVRLAPSTAVFDPGNATGIALDAVGNLYVNRRTYVAAYEPSGAPLLFEGQPLKIGLGSLQDAYGVAVSVAGPGKGTVYVADAATGTLKAYLPSLDPFEPSMVTSGPPGGFSSLTDAAIAVDPSNGHVLVTDNLQLGYEHPRAAINELDDTGVFLDRLAEEVIDAEPPGMAFNAVGNLYVTSGNGEDASVFSFSPYSAGASQQQAQAAGEGALSSFRGTTLSGPPAPSFRREEPGASASELTQRGRLRVSFEGSLSPHALPRDRSAPVSVSVGARIATTDGKVPPQLRRISIAINRNGRFDPTGLPICRLDRIQPSTTADALAACRSSLVGEGRVSAKVLLAGQAPFPSQGKIYAFNSRLNGHPAILAHVYGAQPAPASYTLPFLITKARGTFGTVLSSALPPVTSNSGYITGLQMTLGKSFFYKGKHRTYLSAACPAPKGFPGAVFPFAKASFGFGEKTISSTLTRSCGVR